MNRRLVAIILSIGFSGTLSVRGSVSELEGACQPALNFTYPATQSGPREFNVCLTNDGNVAHHEAPGGAVHIGGADGYLLCTAEDTYWDLGSLGASGFGPATVSQPKGPNHLPVTITRTTLDGAWELRQVFTQRAGFQRKYLSEAFGCAGGWPGVCGQVYRRKHGGNVDR
jgi:hypothetical protein